MGRNIALTDVETIVINMYLEGVSVCTIARVLHLEQDNIMEILCNNQVDQASVQLGRDRAVCLLYQSGKHILEIAKEQHLERHTVTEILRKWGIYAETKHLSIDDPTKQDRNEQVIKLYQAGNSMHAIERELQLPIKTISNILHHFNIQLRPQHAKGHSAGVSKNKKLRYDDRFFQCIDTEQKAYWLGFLFADGYNSGRQLQITLKETDRDHLVQFCKDIGDPNIAIYNKEPYCVVVNISSRPLSQDLTNLGCVKNKSLRLRFPTEQQVPTDLIHHFMRGYFDGDGCISFNLKNNNRHGSFSVIGTYQFIDVYDKILRTAMRRRFVTKREPSSKYHAHIVTLRYSGDRRIKDIYEFLYNNATVFLQRKKDKFLEIIGRLEARSRKSQDNNRGIKRETLSETTRSEGLTE